MNISPNLFVRYPHLTKFLCEICTLANKTIIRFGFPRLPSVRTIISRPEKCNEEYDAGQVALDKVRKVLLDDKVMDKIKEEHYLSPDAEEEEYVRMREVRIRAVLVVANITNIWR